MYELSAERLLPLLTRRAYDLAPCWTTQLNLGQLHRMQISGASYIESGTSGLAML